MLTMLKKVISSLVKKAETVFKPLVDRFSYSRSIRTKLILAFVVPIVLIIIQGIISYSNTSKTAIKLATQSSIAVMESSGKYLEVIFKNVEDQANQIATDIDIQDYFTKIFSEDSIIEKSQLTQRVNNKIITNTSFNTNVKSIMLLSGIEDIASISTTAHLSQLKEAPFVKILETSEGGGAWFGFHKNLDDLNNYQAIDYSLTYMKLIRSLTTMDNVGILVIDIKPETISEMMSGINLGKDQQIHLVSTDGRVITNGNTVEKTDLTDQNFYKDLIGSNKVKGSDKISYKGTKYLMTYYKIGNSGDTLIGLLSESELNSAARQVVVTTVFIIIIAALIAFGTGYVMSNSMSRTIKRIIGASELAASGDLSVNFNSRRQDELGTLARSINSMIGSMRTLINQTLGVSEKVSSSVDMVSSTSQNVSSVSAEISRAIQEISQGASAQAADSEHGVEKISELAENINSVAENARSIDDLTKNTMEMTQDGLSSVNDLNMKANKTTAISREIMTDIQELDVQSKSIGKIVKVISSIADQTNLLALNAAIEAARAGEMGKGFAVVADEVRKLAEQSMDATREISQIIKNTQDKTAKTVEKAAVTETILKSQNDAVQSTNEIFGRIMDSMKTLSVQVEQIMSRISEMEESKEQAINSIQNISAVSQETAASSEEVTASTQEQLASIEDLASKADELKNAADILKQNISRFKLS